MNKNKSKLSVKPAIILMLICIITAFALALTNELTKGPIAEASQAKELQAMQEVLPQAVELKMVSEKDLEYTEGLDTSGEVIGYIFKKVNPGYGGDVTVNIGIDTKGNITGVKPIELAETPGIGMKVENDDFLQQFIGKKEEVYISNNNSGNHEVEGISGATISTSAFIDSVNDALNDFEKLTSN